MSSTVLYPSYQINHFFIEKILANGPLMLEIFKTIQASKHMYLYHTESDSDYKLTLSSVKVIEYYIQEKYPELMGAGAGAGTPSLQRRQLLNIYDNITSGSVFNPGDENNRHVLLKRVCILLAQKIFEMSLHPTAPVQ
jgi:hypothetical protein